MQVVVVSGEHLDDSRRPAKARVRPDEDSLRSGSNEEVDERLRQPNVDLADTQRGPLSPVEQWVVDVDVEAVLVRSVARAEPTAARLAEIPDAYARRVRVAGGVRRDDT
jgi:hypothetical protein